MKTSSKRVLIAILVIMLIVALCSTSKAQEPSNDPTILPDSIVLSTYALDILANPYTDQFTKDHYQRVKSGYQQSVTCGERTLPLIFRESLFLKSFERLRTFPFKAAYQTQHLELTKKEDGSLVIAKVPDPPKTKTFILASIWIGIFFLALVLFVLYYALMALMEEEIDWFIPWDDWDDNGMFNAICTIALAVIPILFIGSTGVGPLDYENAILGAIIIIIVAVMAGAIGYALHPFVGLLFRLAGEIVALLIKAVVWIAVTAYFWTVKRLWKLTFGREKRTKEPETAEINESNNTSNQQ